MPNLVDEAAALVGYLNTAIAVCYQDDFRHGEVPLPGMSPRIRRLKQTRFRAVYRLNRRRVAAGIPISITGAMWMVNQADAGYF